LGYRAGAVGQPARNAGAPHHPRGRGSALPVAVAARAASPRPVARLVATDSGRHGDITPIRRPRTTGAPDGPRSTSRAGTPCRGSRRRT
jgi:hypothetical protein